MPPSSPRPRRAARRRRRASAAACRTSRSRRRSTPGRLLRAVSRGLRTTESTREINVGCALARARARGASRCRAPRVRSAPPLGAGSARHGSATHLFRAVVAAASPLDAGRIPRPSHAVPSAGLAQVDVRSARSALTAVSELREGVLGVRPLERRGEGSVSRDLQVDPGETRPGPEPRWGRDGTGPASDTDQAGGTRALAPGSNAHANYCGPFAGTIQELMMCRQGRLSRSRATGQPQL